MSNLQGKKILVIDDDPGLRELVVHILSRAGAQAISATGGEEGLRLFYAQRPDLVILDVMMPDLDGWEVCDRVRQLSDTPIVFLTALGGDRHIVRGLDCGGVDYMVKPFSHEVLLARVRAALRQAESASGPDDHLIYQDDYLTIDLERRQVLVGGVPVKLTKTEYRLLVYLLRHAGRVVTFEQALEAVWGAQYKDSINYVHVYISYLRRKLEENPTHPRYLLTVHGVGYRFEKPLPAATVHRQRSFAMARSPI